MTVKYLYLVDQQTYINVSRNGCDTDIEVNQVETTRIPFQDEEDLFTVEFSGNDEVNSSMAVRLYIPIKVMEFLCDEFKEYKELNEKDSGSKEAENTLSQQKSDTPNTENNSWAELTTLLSDTSADSMTVAVSVSKKIGAISVFEKFIEQGERGEITPILLEKFPWLLGRDKEALYVNKYTKKEGFAFLSSSIADEMLVIRAKMAEVDTADYRELRNSLDAVSDQYPTKKDSVHGLLIGSQKDSVNGFDTRIQVATWSDILKQAKQSHLAYLKALLTTQPKLSAEDEKVKSIKELGGKEVEELLQKML